ncbi:hypothetical protein ACHQM5_001901 [Ranunculus cassubicifolius]
MAMMMMVKRMRWRSSTVINWKLEHKINHPLIKLYSNYHSDSSPLMTPKNNNQGCVEALNVTPPLINSYTGKKVKSMKGFTEGRRAVREVVEYDSKGQPVGPVAKEFTIFLGILGRWLVPINYESWHKVPIELKDKLWNHVEDKYVVDSKRKKIVLSCIGFKWKTFKTNLYTTYILPFKDQPELLKNPPEQYGFIKQEHWKEFVRLRFSEEFQNIRKVKAAFRLSRKGFAGPAKEKSGPTQTSAPAEEKSASIQTFAPAEEKSGPIQTFASAEEKSGPIQAFSSFIDQSMPTNEIIVPIQNVIFDGEVEVHLQKAHLMQFCNMQEITASCIVSYTGFLYQKLNSYQESYGFVNPASINCAWGPEASSLITKRLQNGKKDQLVFIPYKSNGHWILIVIDSSTMDVYWLDPLQNPPSMDIKIYITTGLKALQTGGERCLNPTWHCIKCPKQALEVQCGYTVLRYMRELMEEPSRPLAERVRQMSKKSSFSQDEIDEVRLELIDYILTHM